METEKQERRSRGSGRVFLRGHVAWIQFSQHGEQVRESTHIVLGDDEDSRKAGLRKAERLLRQRLGEIEAGIAPSPGAARISYESLRDALVADYQANRRKWLRISREGKPYIVGVACLDDFFSGWRAGEISTDAIRAFMRKRQEEGAAAGTVNRSLALLRRMLRLAVEDGKLRDVPHFPMLKEAAPRKGFLEHAGYQRLRQELPDYLRPVLAMGYYTGMRLGEILGLGWSNVDLASAEVRLDPGSTKNNRPRTIPLTGEVVEMLRIERRRHPNEEFVFTHDGERIGSFYKAWRSAAKRANLPGLLYHDLRRTGVRNLIRAGVPERVAMEVSGHLNRNVFDRYNIVSGRDLKDAAAKLDVYMSSQNGDNSGTIEVQESSKVAVSNDQTVRVQ